ncbi:synaptonemal complex protein 1-like [Protopterus annectens]|uniref:synaptonemal complex protein 1-like n=1 Tax=Protopterus annectens TaxID=7888 RepID=UPI001CFB2ABA|nr:synaptonemal complex protein 1-like [Protopterus annectens]
MTSESKAIKKKNADFADHGLRKTKLVSEIEKQNLEHIGPLYSRLYEEADKIKRWKMIIDTDNRQKEKKLQENKRTMEAQRKAIQELQLENEKLSLKLEEAIKENNDLMNEGNATRHLCNLLKETCSRSAERMKKFELEREETRQFCAQNNDNIERMISAFEELCMKAENARLEMLKEESEKREQLRKEYQTELNKMENEASLCV